MGTVGGLSERSEPFPSGEGMEPAELERILGRIDENLLLRPVSGEADLTPDTWLSRLEGLQARIQALRALRAPLFVLGGPVLSKLAALSNVPCRLFGRKQIRFNRELLDALDSAISLLADREEQFAVMQVELERLRQRVDEGSAGNEGTAGRDRSGDDAHLPVQHA